jgi:hypothetical protein
VFWDFTVNTPSIFAIRDLVLLLRCLRYDGKILRNNFSSSDDIVLIMNLLSCEKKKKLPLRPAPSPA